MVRMVKARLVAIPRSRLAEGTPEARLVSASDERQDGVPLQVTRMRRAGTGLQRDGAAGQGRMPPVAAGSRPEAVAADRAYSSRANRAYLRWCHITAAIPEKTDQQANRKKRGSTGGRPVTYDPERYKQRCFQQIKTWRGLATRYGKSPECYEAGLHLHGSIMRLKHLTSTT